MKNDRSASPARWGSSSEASPRRRARPTRPAARAPGGQSRPAPVSVIAAQARTPRALPANRRPRSPPALTSLKETSLTFHPGLNRPSTPKAESSIKWSPHQMRRKVRLRVKLPPSAVRASSTIAMSSSAMPIPNRVRTVSKASTTRGASQIMEILMPSTAGIASQGVEGKLGRRGPDRDGGRRRSVVRRGR